MALLKQDNVQYYHPLDNTTEFTQGLTWANFQGEFVSSILTSGIRINDSLEYFVLNNIVDNEYQNLSGHISSCILFWASGFWNGESEDKVINIGHSTFIGSDPRNGIGITRSLSSASVSLFQQNSTVGTKTITDFPIDNGWNLIIADCRLDGSVWRFRVSISGQPWQDLGTAGTSQLFDDDTRTDIEHYITAGDSATILDEVVLWGNNELFTSGELSKLYNLYTVHNDTMDNYDPDENIELFISGHGLSTDDINLYIPGQVEQDQITLFIATSFPFSGNIDLFILGPVQITDNIDLFVSGPIEIFDNIDLFLKVPEPIVDDFDLFIRGHEQRTLFIHGHETKDESIDLFIKSFPEWGLFASVDNNLVNDNIRLFINGIPSGTIGDIFSINDSINLFINSIEQIETTTNDWSLFVKTESGTVFNNNQDFNLFVEVGGTINDSFTLFTAGHASGEIPTNIQISDRITLFVQGLGENISENYIPFNEFWDIFVKVNEGNVSTIDLFIDGFSWPSGICDLFIFGMTGLLNNNLDLIVIGNEIFTNNANLFIGGITDIETDEITLFIFCDLGESNNSLELYIHGF